MISEERIQAIQQRHEALQHALSNPDAMPREEYVNASKEFAELSPVMAEIEAFARLNQEIGELDEMIADPDSDEDMRELAASELEDHRSKISEAEETLRRLLIPKDEADEKNAILEVRPGTGGDEAALFAGDLFRMYQKYAELHGWKFEIMHAATTDLGGFKGGNLIDQWPRRICTVEV